MDHNEIYQNYKVLLKKLIQFKSVSAFESSQDEIETTVSYYSEIFQSSDFHVEVIRNYDNPIILASYEVSSQAETCLIYGHYDVQPAQEPDWKSNPFDLFEKDDKLFGRGVIDNKGQSLIHISTILFLIESKELKYNVKFIIEGSEEVGSPNISNLIIDFKQKLSADFILISDGSLVNSIPVIEAGLRGILNFELELKTSNKDIHSGMFGTSAPNALHEMSKFLSKIYDANNTILIPGFYDDIERIDEDKRNDLLNFQFDKEKFFEETGTKAILNEDNENFYTQTGLRPTLQITGLFGGHINEGIKTIIPGKATAKINIRLVSGQKPEEIIEKFKNFAKTNIPQYVQYSINQKEMVQAVMLDTNNKYVTMAKNIIKEVYESEALEYYVGGTIPIINFLKETLNIPILSIPLASENGNMHGANENFKIQDIKKGINFSHKFFVK